LRNLTLASALIHLSLLRI